MTDTHEEGVAANLANWNEKVPIHLDSPFYQVHFDALEQGGVCLHQLTIDEMGDVRGMKTAHLQCHIGTDSLSLVRLGAQVTGYDFSQPAIDGARELSKRYDLPADFVCGSIDQAAEKLGEKQFDLVFTSDGVLIWLPDLKPWAEQIAKLLKPGGRFFVTDTHPIVHALGDNWFGVDFDSPEPHVPFAYPYFDHPEGIVFNEPGTYAGPSKDTQHNTSYEWPHPVSSIVNALIAAGLRIDALIEEPACCYPRYSCMTQRKDGLWQLPEPLRSRIPLRLTVKASKAG